MDLMEALAEYLVETEDKEALLAAVRSGDES